MDVYFVYGGDAGVFGVGVGADELGHGVEEEEGRKGDGGALVRERRHDCVEMKYSEKYFS